MLSFAKSFAVSCLCFLAVGCQKFDQDYFLKHAFGFDLQKASEGYLKKERNGLLVIEKVKPDSQLLKKVFPKVGRYNNSYMPVYYLENEISNRAWGESRVLEWTKFDGYVRMSIYYPKQEVLLLGYFSGHGG